MSVVVHYSDDGKEAREKPGVITRVTLSTPPITCGESRNRCRANNRAINRGKARLRLAAVHEWVAHARAIGDAGWHGFIKKLKYKAAAADVHLVKLDQWFANSQTCHCCGHKEPEMPLHKRIWQCPCCGVEHDRDINAALNIQRKGITALQAAGLVVSAHGGQHKSVIKTVAA
ncbi:putative transposase DNA-binding domain protein [Photorhabdus australis subsp. thailandensis]|uniref:Putative transposase DNA-binding domain protein n=1 Tax=Photorhabdus australis subsp. thailandensis TaxID=2805096 RepID=A0A1C0TYU6_9GAMM|nr:putative transposase DNA-binding domain protein [Photorhabdus australis subsp. thailandensis]